MPGYLSKQRVSLLIVPVYYVAALLLVWGGISKILAPGIGDILEILFTRKFIGVEQVIFISKWFPLLEILVALIAVIGIKARIMARVMGGLYLGFAMLILFVSDGYLLLPIDCGCFGPGDTTPVYLLLIRNIFIALPLFFFPQAYQKYTLYFYLKGSLTNTP